MGEEKQPASAPKELRRGEEEKKEGCPLCQISEETIKKLKEAAKQKNDGKSNSN